MTLRKVLNNMNKSTSELIEFLDLITENQWLQVQLMAAEEWDKVKLIALQNAILLNAPYDKSTLLREEMTKLEQAGMPKYALNYAYCIGHSLEDIKIAMADPESSFDNKPEDIDAVLSGLSGDTPLAPALRKLDNFTRSFLSEPVFNALKDLLRKEEKAADPSLVYEDDDEDD